jgi:hypothetical protein
MWFAVKLYVVRFSLVMMGDIILCADLLSVILFSANIFSVYTEFHHAKYNFVNRCYAECQNAK